MKETEDFRFKVVELLGKSALQIQLEVAVGYFVNGNHAVTGHDGYAQDAWDASAAFMKAMERAYSDMEEPNITADR